MVVGYIEEEMKKGIYLDNFGINEYAQTVDKALTIIDFCEKNNISILGGDILRSENNELEFTYNSWYCNQKKMRQE